MTDLTLTADDLAVRFTPAEKALGILRNVTVPRSAITSAVLVRSWRREVRGLRVGLGLPGIRLLGTWRSRGHKQLVALRRDVPAVRIGLVGASYDELLVSTPDAERLVAELG
ncbi:MAG: hypothetical protein HYU55_11695 [Nocardioides sp.]|nr:hypothetical protein [Nocardioides sp.]